jgi:hypothetical protein
MKKLEEAIMRLEAMLSNKCRKVLSIEILLQLPLLKTLVPKTPLLETDRMRMEIFATTKKAAIQVLITAVFRQPSEGRRSSLKRFITKTLVALHKARGIMGENC